MRTHLRSVENMLVAVVLLMVATTGVAKVTPAELPNVAVIRATAWAEGDPAREGASELVVLLEIARVHQKNASGGLVAVGDRRGLFSAGAEEALLQAVLHGVPVVKLSNSGRVLPAPHGLFIDGGILSEQEARQVLMRCFEKYGALPAGSSADKTAITPKLRNHLKLFQKEFVQAAGTQVAAR